MMPTIVNEQAPVPPPAYHRAQARLGPALHIDALTLVNTLHLLALCRLSVRLAHRRCPPPYPAVQEELRVPTAKRPCSSLRFCGRCGGSPIKICMIGCVTGQPSHWRVDFRWDVMACLVFPAPPNSASACVRWGLPFMKRSSSSLS